MRKPLEFIHLKKFATGSGSIVTMKSLITVHDKQFVEFYEKVTPIPADELQEVIL